MKFEWDIDKNSSNKTKHGIDFDTAKELWLDENRVEIRVPYPIEMDHDRQAPKENMDGNLHHPQ